MTVGRLWRVPRCAVVLPGVAELSPTAEMLGGIRACGMCRFRQIRDLFFGFNY